MQANYYIKCDICGAVNNLKYQMGFSTRHPIKFKCTCGVSLRGEFSKKNGISFENAQLMNNKSDKLPALVVYSSGDFLTMPPFIPTDITQLFMPSSFIYATMYLNYDEFRKEFSFIVNYRDKFHRINRAINELYFSGNKTLLVETINKNFNDPIFNLQTNNDTDIFKSVAKINQFQFLNSKESDAVMKITSLYHKAVSEKRTELENYLSFLKKLNYLEKWKRRIYNLCDTVYDKIDLLIPIISVDFYKGDKEKMLDGSFAITTTSFEDIKQLYVDLYELIADILILLVGFDNVLECGDHEKIKPVVGLKVNSLSDMANMRNKGNIIKFLDNGGEACELVCKCMSPDIRNSIGHYDYDSEEIANSLGQRIKFYNVNNKDEFEEKTLTKICYDIWQMYNCMGIFGELIYRLELHSRVLEGQHPSECNDLYKAIVGIQEKKKKIYPNDKCPCGSGLKYKKCCGKK
jgi:hypothetical protein